MAQGRINFTVGFNVDQSGLTSLKSSLASIQNMKLGSGATTQMTQDLQKAQMEAIKVETALQRAFNPTLNTYNIDVFKQKLTESGTSLATIQSAFTKVGAQGSIAFRNLATSITSVRLPLQESHNLLRSMGNTLMNTLKWTVASAAITTVASSVQKAWDYTKELDESLNNIMLVTDKSAASMERFAKQANKAAKELGKSTTDYTNAALIYYQQGLSDEEVAARTETTLKTANVTKQSTDAVSEQLTAVWNGYKVSAQESELYIDKLAAVAATTASDLEELSTGMSKVASAANNMGVDIDQLNGILATAISVTRQAPETVGTAFKTIFARITDIESNLDDETTLGEYTARMAELGFNVLNANGKLRDMGDVIEEIGSNWERLSREQQVALAQTMAGTRQYNNLLALFENWDMYESAMKTSAESVGFLQQQQDEYMESMEAHLEQLETAGQRVYDALFDPDSINPLIDALTEGVDLLGSFVESIGGGGTLLMALVPMLTGLFSGTISSGIATFITNLNNSRSSAEQLRGVLETIREIQFSGEQFDKFDQKIYQLRENLVLLHQQGVITNEEFNNLAGSVDSFANAVNRVDQARQEFSAEGLTNKYNDYMNLVGASDLATPDNKALTTIANYGANTFEQANQSPEEFINYLNSKQASLIPQGGAGVTEAWEKINTSIQNTKNSLSDASTISSEFANKITSLANNKSPEKLKTAIGSVIAETEKLSNSKLIGSAAKAELTKAVNILKEFQAGTKDATTNTKELQAAANTVARITKTGFKNATVAANELTATLETAVTGGFKQAENEANLFGAAATAAFAKANLEARINQFTRLASNIGMATSALTMLFNLGDIWNNEDLTMGEKVLQTIQNIAFATSMFLPIVLSLVKAYQAKAAAMTKDNMATAQKVYVEGVLTKMVNTETDAYQRQTLAKFMLQMVGEDIKKDLTDEQWLHLMNGEAIDDETAAILKNAAAKKIAQNADGFKPGFGKTTGGFLKGGWTGIKNGFSNLGTKMSDKGFGWGKNASGGVKGGGVGGAIGGAAIGLIGGAMAASAIITAFDEKHLKAMEAAESAAKKMRDVANETTASYENLTSSIDNLASQTESLKDLTVGTLEWKKAINDINNEVYTLIEQYPELASSVIRGENGILSISEKALEDLQEKQLETMKNAQVASVSASADVAKSKAELARNELAELQVYGSNANEEAVEVGGVAAGAFTGAAVGATVGSVIPVIGTIVGGIVGVAAGALMGVVAAGAQESAEQQKEAEWEEYSKTSEYQAIANAYKEHGDQIFTSEEALRASLKDTNIVLSDNITALLGNTESVDKLKKTIEAQNQEQSSNYLQAVEIGQQIQQIRGLEASVQKQTNTGLAVLSLAKNQAFKNQFKSELTGYNEADKEAAEYVFGKIGQKYTTIGTDGADMVQAKNEAGEVIREFTMDEIATHYYREKAKEVIAQAATAEELAASETFQKVYSFNYGETSQEQNAWLLEQIQKTDKTVAAVSIDQYGNLQKFDETGAKLGNATTDEFTQLQNAYRLEQAQLAFSDNVVTQEWSEKGLSTATQDKLASASGGEVDFTGLKIKDIEKVIDTDFGTISDKTKKAITQLAEANDSSYDAYIQNIKDEAIKVNDQYKALYENIPVNIQNHLENLDWNMDELSLSIADKFINTYSDLYTAGGVALTDRLDNVITEAGALSDELITELMNQDWSTISDPEDVVNTVLKNTGTEHLSTEAQNALTDIVRILSGKVKDLKTMQSEYAEFQSLMEKATIGASWSAEEYEKLNAEQKKYFSVMADGTALLIGDAYKLKGLLRQETKDNAAYNYEVGVANLNRAIAARTDKDIELKQSEDYQRILEQDGLLAATNWLIEEGAAEELAVQNAIKTAQEALIQRMRIATSEDEIEAIYNEAYNEGLGLTRGIDLQEQKDTFNISKIASAFSLELEEVGALFNALNGDTKKLREFFVAQNLATAAVEKNEKALARLEEDFELLSDTSKLLNLQLQTQRTQLLLSAQKKAYTTEVTELALQFNKIKDSAAVAGSGWKLDDFNEEKILNSWARVRKAQLQSTTTSIETDEAFNDLDKLVKEFQTLQEKNEETRHELIRQGLENNLEAFTLDLSVTINQTEAQKSFNDFQKSILQDNEFALMANIDVSNFNETTKAIDAYLSKLTDLESIQIINDTEFQKLVEANTIQTNMISEANYKAQKEELINKLMEEGVNLLETQKSIEEQYIKYQDAVNAAYERQVELIDSANQALDHQKSLIELMYGDKATKQLQNYYTSQAQNAQKILEQRKAQYAQDKADFDAMNQNRGLYSQEQQEALTSQYIASTNAYLEAVNTTLSARREQFLNESAIALEEFDERITGVGHEKAKEEWDWMQDEADDYLNSLDAAFGIESMIAAYNKAANETTDVRVQQKINELRDKELKILREKDKLSQYDLDRAQKQLDVLQARIALEDAQQNKSQMRLMRGTNGTYSYQYIADQNAIDEAREKLNKAQQELVDLDEEQLKSNTEKIYDIYAEMMEKIAGLTDEAEINAVVEQYTSRLESLGMGMNDLMDNIRASVNMASSDLGLGDNINTIFPWLDSAWMQTVMKSSEEGWGNIFSETVQSILASLERYTEDKDALLGSSSITVGSGTDTIADFDSIVSTFTDQVNEQMVPAQTDVITGLQNMAGEMKILAETTLPGLRLIVEQYKDEIEKTVTDNKFATNTNYTVELSRDDKGQITGATLKAITSAATGMYTGEWGPEGKLAVLHEKELVLNKQDTANILSAVDLVRSLGDSMMNTMAFMSSGYAMSAAAWELAKELIIEQTVNINAEFPNATDRAEIEAAFEELVGLATQHVYENKRG